MKDGFFKFPRTKHLRGSNIQPGDEDLELVSGALLKGQHLVVSEKVDGTNVGIAFDRAGAPTLQTRGQYLIGGPRETQFALLKTWVQRHRETLWRTLGTRYVLFGEWAFAKHTVFYDALPHYFLEFDIFDRSTRLFLDTSSRRKLLNDTPVVSTPVVAEGAAEEVGRLSDCLKTSELKSAEWLQVLRQQAARYGRDMDVLLLETDLSDMAEGLYIKVEANGHVTERFKWVRKDFTTSVNNSETHWLTRPMLPNLLKGDVELF